MAREHSVFMMKSLIALLLLTAAIDLTRADVLFVADEFPAMQFVSGKLKSEEHIKSTVVAQTNLPASLASFEAVVVYIHQGMLEKAEEAFIDYARTGGK